MSWGNLTTEQKQSVYDALNEKAQPFRDYVARDTVDLQSAVASDNQMLVDALNESLATWNNILIPIDDALSLLGYVAPE